MTSVRLLQYVDWLYGYNFIFLTSLRRTFVLCSCFPESLPVHIEYFILVSLPRSGKIMLCILIRHLDELSANYRAIRAISLIRVDQLGIYI